MRADTLKGWLEEARKADAATAKAEVDANRGPGEEETEVERDKDTEKELTNWEKMVALTRADFVGRRLADESMWQMVVLIPKGKWQCRSRGLVKVVWKVVAVIINHRLISPINYHNFLH